MIAWFKVESSVVLKPFLNDLTNSELHAVLTSGFATVAGTVIAAYIEFGVSSSYKGIYLWCIFGITSGF